MSAINNIISQRLRGKTRLRRIKAVIVKAVEGSNDTKFEVSYFENEQDKKLVLLNKSHDVLAEGDHVWIHYWNTISDGYIAIKTGLSDFGVNDDEPIQRPMHSETSVGAAYSFDKGDEINSDYYSYNVTEQTNSYGRFTYAYGTRSLISVLRHQQVGRKLYTLFIIRYNWTLYDNSTIEADTVGRMQDGQSYVDYGTDIATVYNEKTFFCFRRIINDDRFTFYNSRAYIDLRSYSTQLRYYLIWQTEDGTETVIHIFPYGYTQEQVGFFITSDGGLAFGINSFLDTDGSRGYAIAGLTIIPTTYDAQQSKWVLDSNAATFSFSVPLKRIPYNIQSVNHIVSQQQTEV